MPHISKKKLSTHTLELLEKQVLSLIDESGSKTRSLLLGELLTNTERAMLAKRMGILYYLDKGLSAYKISEILEVSPSTAERFERAVEINAYRHTLLWLRKNQQKGTVLGLLKTLTSFAMSGRRRSLVKIVDNL